MTQPESQTLVEIRRGLSALKNVRMWRNNVAQAWAGKVQKISRRCTVSVGPGDVVVRNARLIHAGFGAGSSDMIGYTSIEITQEHVGERMAILTAIEAKTETGYPSPEQLNFIDHIRAAGGRAGIARSAEDAISIVTGGST